MDVLLYQDRKHLSKLLKAQQQLANNCNHHSKKEMIEVLFPALINSNLLKDRFEQLSDDEKKVLLQVCYDKRIFYAIEEISAFIPRSQKDRCEEFIRRIINIGFLFQCSNDRYIMPIQLKRETVQLFKQPFKEQVLFVSFSTERDKSIYVVNDLITFIDYVSEAPLSLTKNGSMYKKDFSAIMNRFEVKEVLPTEQWRFGYGRRFNQYPDRFSLIYDYCFKNRWIKEENGYLMVTSQAERLDDLSVSDLLSRLLNYWLKVYKEPVPMIPYLFRFITELLEEGDAIEEDVITDLLLPFVEEYYYDKKDVIIKGRFLKMLEHFQIVTSSEISNLRCYTIGLAYQLLKSKKTL